LALLIRKTSKREFAPTAPARTEFFLAHFSCVDYVRGFLPRFRRIWGVNIFFNTCPHRCIAASTRSFVFVHSFHHLFAVVGFIQNRIAALDNQFQPKQKSLISTSFPAGPHAPKSLAACICCYHTFFLDARPRRRV
jgi:hypothetical protein